MRQPSILDVVHGVKSVALAHPEVTAWWYTPPQRLRLAGDLARSTAISIEVVVEGAGSAPTAQIAKELSTALSGVAVGVRMHQGDREERRLFRIVSQRSESSSASDTPRPA